MRGRKAPGPVRAAELPDDASRLQQVSLRPESPENPAMSLPDTPRLRHSLVAVLGLALTLVVLGSLLPALTSQASASQARLTITPTSGAFYADGVGFPSNAHGTLTWSMTGGAMQITRVKSDKVGAFRQRLNIKDLGGATLTVSVTIGAVTASNSYTEAAPEPTADPTPEPSPSPSPDPSPAPDPAEPWAGTIDPATPPAWGPQTGYVPKYDRLVKLGELSQSLLDGHPTGTRFALEAGVHRLTSPIRPRSGQHLLGFPGAVINGSKVLTSWQREGPLWMVTGQTQRLHGVSVDGWKVCWDDRPMCNHPEDVFVNDKPLEQVSTKAELRSGTYFFDYANSRIYLFDDPTGRKVETTVAPQGIVDANNVTVRNLVIEKFGNRAQRAALHGSNLTVENNLIRLNHGQGISQFSGVMRLNRVIRNGQLGVAGGGSSGLLVEHNEIAHNNYAGHNPSWEAGGTKWAYATDLTIRKNWSHHNDGSGFTTDVNNYRIVYENNLVEDNTAIGIMHEISYAAEIRNNIVRRNGQRTERWYTARVGISITNSRDTKVYGNLVWENTGGGIMMQQDTRNPSSTSRRTDLGTWELENVTVHSNVVQLVGDGSRGNAHHGMNIHDGVDGKYFSSMNNRFYGNTYHVPKTPGSNGKWWLFERSGRSWSEWKGYGHDEDQASVVTY